MLQLRIYSNLLGRWSGPCRTVAAIRKACTKCGFVYVTGHSGSVGADPLCCHAVMEQSQHFFDLPLATKGRVRSQLTRGYAMQEETLDPAKQTEGDTKEGFYISINDIPVDDPR